MRRTAVLGVVLAATAWLAAATPKFYDDDPIWVEHDTQDTSTIKPWKLDVIADVTLNLFTKLGDHTPNVRARNVNTVDEVPDSSWFTNRAGFRRLTPEEVAEGPHTTTGPAPGRWTITSSKIEGVTPGFFMRDSTGQGWLVKVDPRGYRRMATGTEVVVTKLFWALGYHVTESHIAYLRRDQLAIDDGAKFEPPGGKPRPMTIADITTLLERLDVEPDGSYRVLAGKLVRKLGEFRFFGTNPDDPNDLVPHEHRRELRGYGTFAAWVNHVDSHAHNTLDALVNDNGRAFVRHNLQDFSSTLGAASVGPREYWEGHEYIVEGREALKQMPAFGFYFPQWHTEKVYEARSVGRLPLENANFNPELWKPRVPIQAFLRARADDKFWAAQKLVALTDDLLRAAIRTGEFADPRSEAVLVKVLADRRDAIARAYLPAINPIADAALDGSGVLTFRNAAVDAGVAKPPAGYRAVWFAFDNVTRDTRRVGEASGPTTRLSLTSQVPEAAEFVKLEINAVGGAPQSWETPVHAYFRRLGTGWRLVGFERMPE